MSTHSKLSLGVRAALAGPKAITASICLCVVAAPAWAQPPDAETDDVITVTGSRIRRDAFNSVSPVQVITREEVTIAGFSSTTEALQSTAVTTGAAQINEAFGGFVTDGGPGANTLSLRGL